MKQGLQIESPRLDEAATASGTIISSKHTTRDHHFQNALNATAQSQRNHQSSTFEMSRRFILLVVPSIITQIGSFSVYVLNVVFAGRMTENSTAKMAGVGLGNLFLGLCCRYVLAGINSALETFVSQAYGQGQLRLAGMYLNKGLAIMTAVYVPMVPLLINSKDVLMAVGVDETVAGYAYSYMVPMIPALYMLGYFDLVRRFLTSTQHPTAPMIAQLASSVVHLFLCLKLVHEWQMGVFGLGIATLVSYFVKIGYVLAHMYSIRALQGAYFWPDRSSFQNWKPYLRVSVPATVMLCCEVSAIEVLGVFAGWISVTNQAANAILVTIFAVMFMMPFGAQSAACALIGEQIGANRVSQARDYFKVIAVLTMVFMLALQAAVLGFGEVIVDAITEVPEVRTLTKSSLLIVVLGFTPDCIQGMLQGVIRALSLQEQACYIALIAYYCLAIPLALLFCFKVGCDVGGLWVALAFGQAAQAVLYAWLTLWEADWAKIASESQKLLVSGNSESQNGAENIQQAQSEV